MFHRTFLAALAATVMLACDTHAQVCVPTFLTDEPAQGVPGIERPVLDMTVWDPDGAGPQPDLLVAVGNFDQTGSLTQRSIGAWDGTTWVSLASLTTSTSATAVTVYNNKLIVAGSFSDPGFPFGSLIQYDGVTWTGVTPSAFGRIDSMTVWNGELVIAGSFTNVAGVPVVNIARWNGTRWAALGTGLAHSDGTTQVFALTVHNGDLYAGGRFNSAGGLPAGGLAHWDGNAWSAVDPGFGATVYSLASFQGSLYVGGESVAVLGGPTGSLMRWNGATWTSVLPINVGTGVVSLLPAPTRLYIGSYGSGLTPTVRYLEGNSLTSITSTTQYTPTSRIDALALFRNALIAGGNFSSIGGRGAQNIARYTSFWIPMGPGFENGATRTASIRAAVQDSQNLYVGGFFTGVNGQGAPNAARRTAAGQWIGMGTPGGGINHFLLWDHDGLPQTPPQPTASLNYVPGSQAFPGVRRWDGAAWINVMPRIANSAGGEVEVKKVIEFDGDLVAFGSFDSIDGLPVSAVVRRRNGVWQSLGNNLTGQTGAQIFDLHVHQGDLYASGNFSLTGLGTNVNLARWNGTTWEVVAPQFSTLSPGQLASYQGRLFMTVSDGLAAWDGFLVTRYTLPQYVSNPARTIQVVDGELIFPPYRFTGAAITNISPFPFPSVLTVVKRPHGKLFLGGEASVFTSQFLRCYTEMTLPSDVPVITAHPPAQAVICPDEPISLEVVANSSSTLSYQWQRNGINLNDGRGIEGTRSARLTIRHAYPEDDGVYQCVVTSSCSGTLSTISRITVNGNLCTPLCDDIDFNNNGVFPEDEDVVAFFRVLAGGNCTE